MEGSGTSVETNVNRIQSPISGNNEASYEQKTVAGAEMEEIAGRKELEGALGARLRSASQGNRRQGLQDLVRRGRAGRAEGRQAPPLCPDPVRARLGRPSLRRPRAGLLAGRDARREERRGQPRAAAGAAPGQRDHRRAAGALVAELPAADAAHGAVDRPRRRRASSRAGGALHLRQLRGRQAQRVRLCRRAQHRRAGPAAAGTQPALYFRRRRASARPT